MLHLGNKKINRRLVLAALLLVALVIGYQQLNTRHVLNLTQWPSLTITSLDNQPLATLPGEGWRLINIWATWCEPCRKEMPMLQKMDGHLAADGFSVILLSIDTDLNLVREFVLQYAIDLPLYIAQQSELERVMSVNVFPTSLLVDPNGAIVKSYLGARVWDDNAMLTEIRTHINAFDG
jgi:thiol-disulfide isomerase/thioredoxin